MAFLDDLRQIFEKEETETVGSAFGGIATGPTKSYSVPKIRDRVLNSAPFNGVSPIEQALRRTRNTFTEPVFAIVVAGLVRFSFLIELTNLTVGSTKMKSRWLPGRILMPQPDSFEPVQGTFEPGSDPRAATFDECASIFTESCNIVCDSVAHDPSLRVLLQEVNKLRRVPYEFPLSYVGHDQNPVHKSGNVRWVVNDDLRWLLKARSILRNASGTTKAAIREIEKAKFQVKLYKTDRALTGKDKTNRARRWEVLAGDFQHSPLEDCWSAERKLTTDLVNFQGFPTALKTRFVEQGLIGADASPTLCPVTFEPLSFDELAEAVTNATIGRSQYQIGHLHPLKREGKHDGTNICWQSADGNRIQGDLTVEDTLHLLDQIAERRGTQTLAT